MHITFTAAAADAIGKAMSRAKPGRLKLVYDSEGCGCAVSGVPSLWIVGEPIGRESVHQGEPFEVWVETKHEVFFEDRMTIDYIQDGIRYVLKSSGQIYNAYMNLIDKRPSAEA